MRRKYLQVSMWKRNMNKGRLLLTFLLIFVLLSAPLGGVIGYAKEEVSAGNAIDELKHNSELMESQFEKLSQFSNKFLDTDEPKAELVAEYADDFADNLEDIVNYWAVDLLQEMAGIPGTSVDDFIGPVSWIKNSGLPATLKTGKGYSEMLSQIMLWYTASEAKTNPDPPPKRMRYMINNNIANLKANLDNVQKSSERIKTYIEHSDFHAYEEELTKRTGLIEILKGQEDAINDLIANLEIVSKNAPATRKFVDDYVNFLDGYKIYTNTLIEVLEDKEYRYKIFGPGEIYGFVRDENGNPVEGVIVRTKIDSTDIFDTTRADELLCGFYSLRQLDPKKKYDVTIEKEGYQTATFNGLKVGTHDFIIKLLKNIASVVDKGLEWFRDPDQQKTDGDFVYWTYKGTPNVGVTALVTLAFLNHGYDESDPTVKGALNWLVAQANDDGSISCDTRKVYDTSLAILPLVAAQNEAKYGTVKANARNYLISVQNNEGTGYDPSDRFYGGWGYPRDNWADLSNTQFVVMALDAAGGLTGNVKGNALTFVTRCQNRKESNSEYSSYDDGGFVYQPKSGAKSRGSMTAAGLWGLFLCGVGKNDGKVQDALGWLDERSVEQNDPIGNKWVYYYNLGLAKAYLMAEAGGCEFGKPDWYEDLYAFLSDKQEDDGHWHNIEGANSCDVLATAEAILALSVKEVPERISKLSYMVFKLRSAADLHIYDPEGRHVGLNTETGEVEIGIPDATYSEKPIEIKVPNLDAGGYKAVLIGTEAGEYELEVIAKTGNKTLAEASYEGWITEGATQEMVTTISSIVGPLDVRIGTLEAVAEEEDSYSEQFSLDAGDELEIDAIDETGVLLRIGAEEDCEGEVKISDYSENPTINGFPGEYKYYALEKFVDISLDVDKEKIDWPVYLEVHYDEDELPENVDKNTLTIYHYMNDTKWRSCNDFEVNPEENYISAELEKDELCYFGMGGLYAPFWARYSMLLIVIAIVIVLALGYFSVRRYVKSRRVKAMKVPERVPAEVAITIYNFDNSFRLLKEREETAKILDGLDGRLASGEIKEETYNDLKSKYESKIGDLNRKIKSELERAKAYLQRIEDERTKLQRTHENLNAELQKEKGRKKKAEISARINGISAEIERVDGIIRTMKEKIGVIEAEFTGD